MLALISPSRLFYVARRSRENKRDCFVTDCTHSSERISLNILDIILEREGPSKSTHTHIHIRGNYIIIDIFYTRMWGSGVEVLVYDKHSPTLSHTTEVVLY